MVERKLLGIHREYLVIEYSKGDKLYVTWNASRGGKVWDCCALTAIHIPKAER